MIRQASAGELDTLLPHTEAALKICGLYQAYGADKRFCRFWKWGQGGYLVSLDGAAVLYANEEKGWRNCLFFYRCRRISVLSAPMKKPPASCRSGWICRRCTVQ